MKKILSLIIVFAIIMSMGFSFQAKAESQVGWHLVDIEFKDATDSWVTSMMGNNAKMMDEVKYTGEKGDMTVTKTVSEYDPETKTVGKLLHGITTRQIWNDPQSYVRAGENISISAESMLVSSAGSWETPANFHVRGPLIPYNELKTSEGSNSIKNGGKATFITEEAMPEGREGQTAKIEVYVGEGYKYNYSYEWKEAETKSASKPGPRQENQSNIPNLKGEWDIVANKFRGLLNITNQTGTEFTGTLNLGTEKDTLVANGNIKGNTITFTRKWTDWDFTQEYTGTLTIEDGLMKIKGTFISDTISDFKWKAEKEAPKSTPRPAPAPNPTLSSGNSAEAFESGSRIMWNPAEGLGYRLFRSTTSNDLGISVTDFYITSTSYADVNVEPNTTYYYTVKPVLAEAKPFEGIDEKLGNPIATYVVKTGDQIYKPGSFKHFIMLKLDSPYMSVDGISQEVDPGRGTKPLIINGRTMVPIRAIVEAMGGTVDWDGNTKKITLKARGNTVEMWLGKKDIKVNGEDKKMDISAAIKNGRTFVPVRFAAENLNTKVDWINSTKEVVIVYEE